VLSLRFLMAPKVILISLMMIGLQPLNGCSGTAPGDSGMLEGKLAPCPSSPNCVSSQSTDRTHAIAPLTCSLPPERAFKILENIVTGMDRATVVTATGDYLHATFRSRLGFVDDVEFFRDRANAVMQMRSAARSGYWDLGVNRRRLETIRQEFMRKCQSAKSE
jgi:uncharacterized protein (DUF1499 family)